MSVKLPKEVRAFNEVIQAYYTCKVSPKNGGGFYATLANGVHSVCGKVRVTPQDMVADVELAAQRALRDFPAELHVFKRVYLDADEDFATVFARRIGQERYDEMLREMISRISAEWIKSGIWPLHTYRREVDTR